MKAFVLIGLGFSQRRLYLARNFLSNKPVEVLFGSGISNDLFTEECFIQQYGTTSRYSAISVNACTVQVV